MPSHDHTRFIDHILASLYTYRFVSVNAFILNAARYSMRMLDVSRSAFWNQTISNISSEHGRSMMFSYWHTIFVCTAAWSRIVVARKTL
jgi:hypothetical protein